MWSSRCLTSEKLEEMKMQNEILSTTYQLTSPGVIETKSIKRELLNDWVVIRPTLASVCHADLRYYTGNRRPEALKKKLPMALLHEGIGTVIQSNSSKFSVGERVVIVPNIPGEVLDPENFPNTKKLPVNYTKGNQFLGSGYDGIAQSHLVHPADCLVKIPDNIPDEIAVLAELCTVSYHAISHIIHHLQDDSSKIALFGDGPVGYLTAAMITSMYNIPKDRFTVFGADREKLNNFYFTNQEMVQEYDFESPKETFNIILECTGGKFSESAINQAISLFEPCGHLVLMGVTEDRVPINTRDILEKGLTLYGSSRSSTADFQAVIDAMANENYQKALRQILPNSFDVISNGDDFKIAMDQVVANRAWKKTILDFKF